MLVEKRGPNPRALPPTANIPRCSHFQAQNHYGNCRLQNTQGNRVPTAGFRARSQLFSGPSWPLYWPRTFSTIRISSFVSHLEIFTGRSDRNLSEAPEGRGREEGQRPLSRPVCAWRDAQDRLVSLLGSLNLSEMKRRAESSQLSSPPPARPKPMAPR